VGWYWVSWYCGHYWPIVPAPDDRWWPLWRNWWNEDWQGKPKYSEKTCPSATLFTSNPTWLDPVNSQRLTTWVMARPILNCWCTWYILVITTPYLTGIKLHIVNLAQILALNNLVTVAATFHRWDWPFLNYGWTEDTHTLHSRYSDLYIRSHRGLTTTVCH
jgi:hypothetical protein